VTSKTSLPAKGGYLKGEIARLEERFRHELLDVEERDLLRCRIIRLKRKAGAR
jgi:hypothetical protein